MLRPTTSCIVACCLVFSTVDAEDESLGDVVKKVQDLLVELKDEAKQNDATKRTQLELARTQLKQMVNDLEEAKAAVPSNAGAAIEEATKWLEKADTEAIAKAIGASKPMTAVLFTWLDRGEFEVVPNPDSADPTVGIINQNQDGTTAGILIAAEAPFAYPSIKRKSGKRSRVPIGAWFGVNLSTGGGADVSDVDLAAGFSFSFISAGKVAKVLAGDPAGLAASARFLVGAVYGDATKLGPRDDTSNLEVGDPYPLGSTIPVTKDKQVRPAIGIGFRF